MTKLLVYGTLKSDGALHKALEGSKLIDRNYITFSKKFVMTSAGGNSFPYIYEIRKNIYFLDYKSSALLTIQNPKKIAIINNLISFYTHT